jgi:tetratricopeptide (TPR) repeat protein
MLYANLAAAHAADGDSEHARRLYARGLELVTKGYGPKHALVARVQTEKAHMHRALGERELAVQGLEQALAVREQTLAGNDPELARTLDALGALLAEQGELERAAGLLRRAVAIREMPPQPDPQALGWSLRALGSVYARQERLGEAERTLRRALELLEPALGANDPFVLDTRRQHDLVLRSQQIREPGRTGG